MGAGWPSSARGENKFAAIDLDRERRVANLVRDNLTFERPHRLAIEAEDQPVSFVSALLPQDDQFPVERRAWTRRIPDMPRPHIEMGFGGDMTSVKTLVFGNQIASWLSRGDGFGCSICDSPALAYPIRLKDDEPVACGRCGEFVSTYGDLKKQFESVLTSNRTSGC